MDRLSIFHITLYFYAIFVQMRAELPYADFVDKGLNHRHVCSRQPAVSGPCEAAIPRFSYHPESNECKEFTYGGCQGNENNFDTEGHCKRVCINKWPCAIPGLQRPKPGCRYDETFDEMGCPDYKIVCDVKPGQCPSDHERGRQGVTFECNRSDAKCPGTEKCCKIGQSRVCVPPITQ